MAVLSVSAQKSNSNKGSFSTLVTSRSWGCIFTSVALPLTIFFYTKLEILEVLEMNVQKLSSAKCLHQNTL